MQYHIKTYIKRIKKKQISSNMMIFYGRKFHFHTQKIKHCNHYILFCPLVNPPVLLQYLFVYFFTFIVPRRDLANFVLFCPLLCYMPSDAIQNSPSFKYNFHLFSFLCVKSLENRLYSLFTVAFLCFFCAKENLSRGTCCLSLNS